MEWDDYLRQQAAMYRQLAEKAEDAVVKQELLELADVCGRPCEPGDERRPSSNFLTPSPPAEKVHHLSKGSLISTEQVGQNMQVMGVIWRLLQQETNNPEHPGKLADYAAAVDFDVDLHIGDHGFTADIQATSKFAA